LQGTISREVGIFDAIPQLATLSLIKPLGGTIQSINNRAKLKGEISPALISQPISDAPAASGQSRFFSHDLPSADRRQLALARRGRLVRLSARPTKCALRES